jgi:hypothetical protein
MDRAGRGLGLGTPWRGRPALVLWGASMLPSQRGQRARTTGPRAIPRHRLADGRYREAFEMEWLR